MILDDGTVLTDHTDIFELAPGFDYAAYDFRAPKQGIVKKIYYPNDPDNKSKKWVEADVLCLSGRSAWIPVPRAKIATRRGGYENFEEWYPQPYTKNVGGGELVDESLADNETLMSDPYDIDTEWVLVDFVDNNPHDAWIRPEALQHAKSLPVRVSKHSTDGDIKAYQHNGLRHEIDKNGDITIESIVSEEKSLNGKQGKNLTINLLNEDGNGLSVEAINRGGDLTFEIKQVHGGDTSYFKFEADHITVSSTKKIKVLAPIIELGSATLEFIVKATKLKTWIVTQINAMYNAHLHTGNLGYSTTPPLTPLIDPSESDLASEKHVVE